jgi:hypothetical protein
MLGRIVSVAALASALALAPAGAAEAPFKATMKAPGHHPKANKRWPVTVTARTPDGTPVKATLRYVFLYKGRIVSRQSNYHFTGTYTDNTFVWPSRAIGIPLTLRCQITSKLGTIAVDYRVRVRR